MQSVIMDDNRKTAESGNLCYRTTRTDLHPPRVEFRGIESSFHACVASNVLRTVSKVNDSIRKTSDSLLNLVLLLGSIEGSLLIFGIGATVYPAATASGMEACLLEISCFSAVDFAFAFDRAVGLRVGSLSASAR